MKSAQDGACLIAGHSIGPKVVLLNIATAEMLEPIVIMRWELPALKVDTERHPPPRVRKGSLSSRVACYAFFLVGLASTGPIGSFRCFSAIWGARYSRPCHDTAKDQQIKSAMAAISQEFMLISTRSAETTL